MYPTQGTTDTHVSRAICVWNVLGHVVKSQGLCGRFLKYQILKSTNFCVQLFEFDAVYIIYTGELLYIKTSKNDGGSLD